MASTVMNFMLCTAIFLLTVTSASNVAVAAPANIQFFLDCSNKPPTVSSAQPSKVAECDLGSVTSVATPWDGTTFTISDDKSTATFQMHGPGIGTMVEGTYRVLDVSIPVALAQGTFGPVVLNNKDCANPDIVTGTGTASKGEKVSKVDGIQIDITFTSVFKETVCSSNSPTSTSVSIVSASCGESAQSSCLPVPEFGASVIIPAALGFVVVVLLTELRGGHQETALVEHS
jgi:hypothetical protein